MELLYLYVLLFLYVAYASRDHVLAFVYLALLYLLGYKYTLYVYLDLTNVERFYYVNSVSVVLLSSLYRLGEVVGALWTLVKEKRKENRYARLHQNNSAYISLYSVLRPKEVTNPRSRRSRKPSATVVKTRSLDTSTPSRKRDGRNTKVAF